MHIHKKSKPTKYIALDEQNSYRWKIQNDEGILGLLDADYKEQEQVILKCQKK